MKSKPQTSTCSSVTRSRFSLLIAYESQNKYDVNKEVNMYSSTHINLTQK